MLKLSQHYILLLIAFTAMTTVQVAQAEPSDKVAVLMTKTNAAPTTVINQLADGLREGALRAKSESSATFDIMSRESMAAVLDDQGIDASCVEGNCEVETARNLRAKYVLSGTLSLIEGTYLLTAKIHDVKSASLLKSDKVKHKTMLGLIEEAPSLGYRLFRSLLSTGTELSVNRGTVGDLEDIDRGENRVYNADAENSGILMVKSSPPGVEVTINPGNFNGSGTFMQELAPDTYVVVGTLGLRYHPAREEVTVEKNKKITLELVLKPAFGTLQIESSPAQATVYVDGVKRGRTPLELPELLSGRHVIKLEMADHHIVTETVQIEDEKETTLNLQLEASIGGLKISSSPTGATVWLGGQNVGKTPYSVDGLDPGTYPIRLSMPLHLDVNEDLIVEQGRKTEFKGDLTPNFGHLTVESNPPGSELWIDGNKTGETPHTTGRLAAGSVEIQVRKAGYGDWSKIATIRPEETTVMQAELQAKLGRLLVTARYPDGNLCADEGSIKIDGKPAGSLPYMDFQIALPHRVEVNCKGMRGAKNFTITHNQRTELEIAVAMFSRGDLSSAESSFRNARRLDGLGLALGLGMGAYAGLQGRNSNTAFAAASGIKDPNSQSEFDAFNQQGRAAQTQAMGFSVAATTVVTTAAIHWVIHTRQKRSKLRQIREVMGD